MNGFRKISIRIIKKNEKKLHIKLTQVAKKHFAFATALLWHFSHLKLL
jgi:hypothetical protein